MDVVSLKTIDPSSPSYANGKATNKILEYVKALDVNITIDDVPANRILDVRIPEGTENMLNIEKIRKDAVSKGITVKVEEFK